MEKVLKPERFDCESSLPQADKIWSHWKKTFENFLLALERSHVSSAGPLDKLSILINYVSPGVFEYISEANSYADAISTLQSIFVKPKSEIFARHILATRKQDVSENLDQYIQVLKQLSKECNFQTVDANHNREDSIRDAFITGLRSPAVRQRLLENQTLTMKEAFEQARALELAQKQAESYSTGSIVAGATSDKDSKLVEETLPHEESDEKKRDPTLNAAHKSNLKCFYCGNSRHQRFQCPARNAKCLNCQKSGHYARVCRSRKPNSEDTNSKQNNSGHTSASMSSSVLASAMTNSTVPSGLSKASFKVHINGYETEALVDSGSI